MAIPQGIMALGQIPKFQQGGIDPSLAIKYGMVGQGGSPADIGTGLQQGIKMGEAQDPNAGIANLKLSLIEKQMAQHNKMKEDADPGVIYFDRKTGNTKWVVPRSQVASGSPKIIMSEDESKKALAESVIKRNNSYSGKLEESQSRAVGNVMTLVGGLGEFLNRAKDPIDPKDPKSPSVSEYINSHSGEKIKLQFLSSTTPESTLGEIQKSIKNIGTQALSKPVKDLLTAKNTVLLGLASLKNHRTITPLEEEQQQNALNFQTNSMEDIMTHLSNLRNTYIEIGKRLNLKPKDYQDFLTGNLDVAKQVKQLKININPDGTLSNKGGDSGGVKFKTSKALSPEMQAKAERWLKGGASQEEIEATLKNEGY